MLSILIEFKKKITLTFYTGSYHLYTEYDFKANCFNEKQVLLYFDYKH